MKCFSGKKILYTKNERNTNLYSGNQKGFCRFSHNLTYNQVIIGHVPLTDMETTTSTSPLRSGGNFMNGKNNEKNSPIIIFRVIA